MVWNIFGKKRDDILLCLDIGTEGVKALIFRVIALDDEKPNSLISRLVVIGLTGNKPRYCGTAKTNIEAYAIADKSINCTDIETTKTVPK